MLSHNLLAFYQAEIQLNLQKRRGHGLLSVLRPKFSGLLGEALDVAVRWSGDVVSTNTELSTIKLVGSFMWQVIIINKKILLFSNTPFNSFLDPLQLSTFKQSLFVIVEFHPIQVILLIACPVFWYSGESNFSENYCANIHAKP